MTWGSVSFSYCLSIGSQVLLYRWLNIYAMGSGAVVASYIVDAPRWCRSFQIIGPMDPHTFSEGMWALQAYINSLQSPSQKACGSIGRRLHQDGAGLSKFHFQPSTGIEPLWTLCSQAVLCGILACCGCGALVSLVVITQREPLRRSRQVSPVSWCQKANADQSRMSPGPCHR